MTLTRHGRHARRYAFPPDSAQPGQARRHSRRASAKDATRTADARARQYAVAFLGGYLPPF